MRMPEHVLSLLSPAPDSVSSSRAVKVLWFAAVVGVWCWVSITGHQLAEIPDNVIWISGIIFGGAVVQKKIEQPGRE